MSIFQTPWKALLLAGIVAAGAAVFAQVTQIPVTVEDEPQVVPEGTKLNMESKLIQSQRILEGLVRRDFQQVEEAAAILQHISLLPPPSLKKAGDESDAAVYEHFRLEFARLVNKLQRSARRKEPDATAYVQQNLTATCIACHDYIRD